eukprot:scaffold25702_cov97-Skeletonema_dohrnii-CCMP3373.AAC.1
MKRSPGPGSALREFSAFDSLLTYLCMYLLMQAQVIYCWTSGVKEQASLTRFMISYDVSFALEL